MIIPDFGDGISKSRLERLTDGVFAIVMTILVLEITIPHLSPAEVPTELPKQLINLLPALLGYITSFIILGFFWIGHDDQFHYIRRVNRTLLGISIFYLMFIALIPFSTSLLGEYGNQQISVLLYGINLLICSIWNYLHWWYATKNHLLIDKDLDAFFIKLESKRYLINISIYLVAILISFVNINISTLLYIATPIYYLIPLQKNEYLFWSRKK
jgi:uncharacterized membrane protein